jgi:hypothetical protein
MKNFILLLIIMTYLLYLQTTSNQAFADAKMTDTTKELIKKMDEASGIEKLKKVKSLRMKSTIEIPDAKLSGTAEVITLGDKAYQKASIAGSDQESGFDGKISWGNDLMQGNRELKGQERENIIQSSLKFLQNPVSYYTEIIQEKDEKFQEKDCFVLIYKKDPNSKAIIPTTNILISPNALFVHK